VEHVIAALFRDFEQGKITRREAIQSVTALAMAGSAIAATQPVQHQKKIFKAVGINHVSYQVSDYARTRDFYAGIFGMQVSEDTGKECTLKCGNDLLIVRNLGPRPSSGDGVHGSYTPGIDHIAYTIANWDRDKNVESSMQAEMKLRGLEIRPTKVGFHITDPDGFDVQIGGKNQ